MNHTIKRNEIYYADLSPVQGSEQVFCPFFHRFL